MEGIHGVDVSWLHHSHKEHNQHSKSTYTTTPKDEATPNRESEEPSPSVGEPSGDDTASPAPPPTTQSPPSPTPQHHSRRPHLLNRASSEKQSSLTISNGGADQKAQVASTKPLPSPSRRNSWMSSISSKFSSSAQQALQHGEQSPVAKLQAIASSEAMSNTTPLSKSPPAESSKRDPLTAYVPVPPKSSQPSFLTSAFRRLSSSAQSSSIGKIPGYGGTCERRVMNKDTNRERCRIEELDQAKLRRVAFCVDVEIAGSSRYVDEGPSLTPQYGRRPSLEALENAADKKKKSKHKKLKEKGEGEALKKPEIVAQEKDSEGVVKVSGEEVGTEDTPNPEGTVIAPKKEPSRKKEKKKRSEGERKERKERKRKQAQENGTAPVEMSMNDESSTSTSTPPGASTPKSQDHPTTDPLRIYRRCCQLRETSILKKVTEQLSDSSCLDGTPGVVTCLDFTGYSMQLADVVTLGDYLAVVPVKKLVLENCDLNDEALRVILCGLLASKVPKRSKSRARSNSSGPRSRGSVEARGLIERLSLKNNPKIGPDGWRHISLFVHLSHSIKAIDISMIPFPQPLTTSSNPNPQSKSLNGKGPPSDISTIFSKAIAERLAGAHLEELIMTECYLNTEQIARILKGVTQSRLKRLGLASNGITREGLEHVARYIEAGICEGLDLGGNDLHDDMTVLRDALGAQSPLWAVSLADCNLTPSSLSVLFPSLVALKNLRFIDLSHNRSLFATQPDALGLLRRYLPRLPIIKRLHLCDVAMTPEHAIALAEILPEIRTLAHLNILENPQVSALATANDEASQEEACALYASLMAAVRVSQSIICIDVDVPGPETSEVVKALAKQVVAYCLRNMELAPIVEPVDAAGSAFAESHGGEKDVAVPEVLLHLVGHADGHHELHDDDEPAPDADYVIGGTGVVKALGVCLGNKASDLKRPSREISPALSGTVTPKATINGPEFGPGKAKEMSKNLLGSARKIRARLQPALVREQSAGADMNYRRLLFLDSTLERMIQRFEDEYPECRLAPPTNQALDTRSSDIPSPPSSYENTSSLRSSTDNQVFDASTAFTEAISPTETSPTEIHPPLSRADSDVSLASRAYTQEEGRMHRFGQQLRRDILKPQFLDHAHGTTGDEDPEPEHLQVLRDRLSVMDGEVIREKVEKDGMHSVLREIGASAEELEILQREDPGAFQRLGEEFREGPG
ncbi:MAG: hypothetical protein M1835_005626 [Candelina submexicana]|nr:MAG: hypothetical protein M1835_005626 [Candelina submexicana]